LPYLHSFPTRRSADLPSLQPTEHHRKHRCRRPLAELLLGPEARHFAHRVTYGGVVVDLAPLEVTHECSVDRARQHDLQNRELGEDRKSTRLNSSHVKI